MKNLFNIGFVVLILVVLGCNCQKLQELANESKTTPSSSPSSSPGITSSPTSSSSPSSTSKSALTMDKYNQIKNGMSYKEVVAIVGSEGTETMSSGEGKYKVTSYQWKGDDDKYEYIYAVFMGDKLSSKTQANLK
jgi:hypothetical protein